MEKCTVCGKKMENVRSDKSYCSPVCKSKAQRGRARVKNTARARLPNIDEKADLLIVKSLSEDCYDQLMTLWHSFGKEIGLQALDVVWALVVDKDLLPKEYYKRLEN